MPSSDLTKRRFLHARGTVPRKWIDAAISKRCGPRLRPPRPRQLPGVSGAADANARPCAEPPCTLGSRIRDSKR